MQAKNWRLMELVRWRWVSILLLGISVNFLVNWIFNFRSPIRTFHWEEYLVAVIFSFFILEGIRFANRLLSRKFSYEKSGRNTVLFLADVLLVLLVVNGVGTAYMLLIYGDTYSSGEYLVINLVTMTFTSIFILIDLLLHAKNVKRPTGKGLLKPISVTNGNARKWIMPEEIRFCYLQNGLTYVVCEEGRFITDHNLNQLIERLPADSFIRANRQFILTRSMIDETRSSDYGKLEISLKSDKYLPRLITVSRKQASTFRKWLKTG